jgi:hypothetical protein
VVIRSGFISVNAAVTRGDGESDSDETKSGKARRQLSFPNLFFDLL